MPDIFICIAQAVLIASATFYIALSFPALLAVFYLLQKILPPYIKTAAVHGSRGKGSCLVGFTV
jgi:hypothetical protein